MSKIYDVTLYWHDGGSVCLGVVSAVSAEDAGEKALQQYAAQSEVQALEIEEGGGYQLEADLLPADEATAWRARRRV